MKHSLFILGTVVASLSLAAAANAEMLGCYYGPCSESEWRIQERNNYEGLRYEQEQLRQEVEEMRFYEGY